MAKNYKLDLFDVLKHANNKDYDYFKNLSVEEKAEFQPWLAMRFMSSSPNGISAMQSIMMTHYALNKDFNVISKNKELFYRLMCVVGDGTYKKHTMIKPPSGKHKTPLITELVSELNGETLEDEECFIFLSKNDLGMTDLKDIAEDLLWDKPKINNLKKSYDELMKLYGN